MTIKTKGKPAARKHPSATADQPVKRRPGRPSGVENGLLDRNMILSVSFQLTKSVSLVELSIVKVARELGVTPALIHYYLGGRDALTSGVINAFYREIIESWPKEDGDWRHNVEVVADAIYRAYIRYPGVAAYIVSHNKYRMVQEVREGETDYGILLFEKFTSAVRAIGFGAAQTAIYAHLLIDFVTANAHATVRHRWPGEHSDFLGKTLAQLDPVEFPATHFVKDHIIRLNASAAFATGLRLFIRGLELERPA